MVCRAKVSIDMPIPQTTSSLSIPLSAWPAVELYRPLVWFGPTFSVLVSSVLTLSPHTVLQVTSGLSILELIRKWDQPEHGVQGPGAAHKLKDLMRGALGRNVLSTTTKHGVKNIFGAFFSRDVLDAALAGNEVPDPTVPSSDWEAVLKGMGAGDEGFLAQLVQHMSRLDGLAACMNGSAEVEVTKAIGPYLEWCLGQHSSTAKVKPQVAILVDSSLRTLCWMETLNPPTPSQRSVLLPMLAQGKTPIGNWLLGMQQAAGCSTLAELSSLVLRKGVLYKGRAISHDLLKKWSSGQQLMPLAGAQAIIQATGSTDPETARNLFGVVRFLAFLCDFLAAGTEGENALLGRSQREVRRRYCELTNRIE